MNKDGVKIPAVAQITKQGLLFILNRETGVPVFWKVEERSCSGKRCSPGEYTWPTQPFPLKPVPLARMSMTRDEVSKLSPATEKTCTEQFDKLVTMGPFTPYGMEPSMV